MSYVIIRQSLETRLNAIGVFPTAFENVPFNPIAGTPWQRARLLPARTENPTQGDAFKREIGIFEVMLAYPQNAGPQLAATRANLIVTSFPKGWSLVVGTLRVLIDRSPFIGQGIPDGAWYKLPVSIPYIADVYSG